MLTPLDLSKTTSKSARTSTSGRCGPGNSKRPSGLVALLCSTVVGLQLSNSNLSAFASALRAPRQQPFAGTLLHEQRQPAVSCEVIRRIVKTAKKVTRHITDKADEGEIPETMEAYLKDHAAEAKLTPKKILKRLNKVTKVLSGRMKAPDGIPDTEQSIGAIEGALTGFPALHEFKAVGRTPSEKNRHDFVLSMVDAVTQTTGQDVREEHVSVWLRMGGRFTTVAIQHEVQNAEQIREVLNVMAHKPDVVMHW